MTTAEIESEGIIRVLEQYPVRLAIWYGSQVRGTATDESDVDVAVAFDEELSASERLEYRIELTSDLIEALGTDAVDVADLDSIRPAVGASALRTGTVLLDTQDAIEEFRDRFEDRSRIDDTHTDRMERFDALLDRLEAEV